MIRRSQEVPSTFLAHSHRPRGRLDARRWVTCVSRSGEWGSAMEKVQRAFDYRERSVIHLRHSPDKYLSPAMAKPRSSIALGN